MKKSVLALFSVCLVISFTSCKKEVIEIVNQPEDDKSKVEVTLRSNFSSDSNGGGGEGEEVIIGVTDPNEDDDFTKIKKNKVINGK